MSFRRECVIKEKANLLSEKGLYHSRIEPADVKAVFGKIKGTSGFKPFMLRGKPKIVIETGLMAIAHNEKKWSNKGFLLLHYFPFNVTLTCFQERQVGISFFERVFTSFGIY